MQHFLFQCSWALALYFLSFPFLSFPFLSFLLSFSCEGDTGYWLTRSASPPLPRACLDRWQEAHSHHLSGNEESHQESDSGGYGRPPPEDDPYHEAGAGRLDRWVAFTLVAVPGLFMTLDSLERALRPLLKKYPLARVVLAGLPGLPNTFWPEGWTLSLEAQVSPVTAVRSYDMT